MNIVTKLFNIVIDALFPLNKIDQELYAMSPEIVSTTFAKASPYDNSVLPLSQTHSIFSYKDERVAKLIWNIKYKRNTHCLNIGAYFIHEEMVRIAAENPENMKTVAIPIPISRRRRRERGYNQIELLLDETAKLDTQKMIIFENNLLVRKRHEGRQTLKDREGRLESSFGIFEVDTATKEKLYDKYGKENTQIIIVDDVITTGSTMKEAQDTLKSAGFENVGGLSLAH